MTALVMIFMLAPNIAAICDDEFLSKPKPGNSRLNKICSRTSRFLLD